MSVEWPDLLIDLKLLYSSPNDGTRNGGWREGARNTKSLRPYLMVIFYNLFYKTREACTGSTSTTHCVLIWCYYPFPGGDKLTQLEKRAKRRAIRQLHDAVVKNNVSLVEELMCPELDVNFHYGGQTALQLAVLKGFEDICQVLINHEGDVDKANAENNSLLNMAAWKGYSNIVQMLVSHGAELNTSNNYGATSLNTAAYRGYPTITQILIDAGAFIDKPNLRQQTPLFLSCKRGHHSVAKLLIEAGCDLNWSDVERKSPLIAADEKGHSRIVQLLVDSGIFPKIFFILRSKYIQLCNFTIYNYLILKDTEWKFVFQNYYRVSHFIHIFIRGSPHFTFLLLEVRL